MLGAVFGILGIVVLAVMGRRKTTEGAAVGFGVRLAAVAALCFAGGLMAGPETVIDENCQCSFTLDKGMRHGGLDKEADFADFTAANPYSELYLVDEVLPKSDFWPVPVAHIAEDIIGFAQAQPGVRVVEPAAPVFIGGRPAVLTEHVRQADDVEVYEVMAVVEAPTTFHLISAWTLSSRQSRNKDTLHSVIATFQPLDEADGDPWVYPLFDGTPQEARQGIQPASVARPWGDPSPAPPPPRSVFRRIRYDAPLGRNVAYVTPDPKDGARHPAVLWAHGGFGGIDSWFWEPASHQQRPVGGRVSARRGSCSWCPRGAPRTTTPGNSNSSSEKSTTCSPRATTWPRLPTSTQTESTLRVTARAEPSPCWRPHRPMRSGPPSASAGAPSMVDVRYGEDPYGLDDREQVALRSAILFTPAIQQPTFYFEGAEQGDYLDDARAMQSIAEARDIPFRMWAVDGHDHFTILAPLTTGIAATIVADTDGSRPFELSDDEGPSVVRRPDGMKAAG